MSDNYYKALGEIVKLTHENTALREELADANNKLQEKIKYIENRRTEMWNPPGYISSWNYAEKDFIHFTQRVVGHDAHGNVHCWIDEVPTLYRNKIYEAFKKGKEVGKERLAGALKPTDSGASE